ncbi:MAG: DUF4173 domain-containing protein [Acidimicrobiales bacterium]|nr:DUF4173 domain-containing protein [Acidimicrobiales bacterium]
MTTTIDPFWPDAPDSPPAPPLDLRWFVAAVVIGIGFDLAMQHPAASVATALFFALAAASLLWSRHLRTTQSRVLVALSPVFAMWTVFRVTPWLIPLDLVAAGGLLLLGAATATQAQLANYGLRDLLGMPWRVLGCAVGSVVDGAELAAPVLDDPRRQRVWGVVVGLCVAVPIVAVLGGLLAAGDANFSSLLGSLTGAGLVTHALLVAIGTAIGAVVVRFAMVEDPPPSPPLNRWAGAVEAVTVLACVGAVYAAFVVAQVSATFGDVADVLDDPYATRAWVHEGFFALLWAAGITLVVLLAADGVTRRESGRQRRWFRWAATVTAGLTLVVVIVAMARIADYSSTFGLTILRLYTFLFAGWIGVVFLLLVLRVWDVAGFRRWFTTAAGGAGLAVLLALNVANPEAVVVRWDIARADTVEVRAFLHQFSDDAIPALVEGLDDLPADDAAALRSELCEVPVPSPGSGLSWNRSRSRAASALAELCD